MGRNGEALIGSRLSHLTHSKEFAKDNGVPVLAWVLIILVLALFVGFVVWWYRRLRAARAALEPVRPSMEEIELPVPTAAEMAALARFESQDMDQEAPDVPAAGVDVAKPPLPLDLEALPPAVPEPSPLPDAQPEAVAATRAADVTPAAPPDDLIKIEGIGLKIASLLRAAGITTFSQLASTETDRLREILAAANLRFVDPTTWPEQARLAAAGDWAAFETLTRELRGGRRAPGS